MKILKVLKIPPRDLLRGNRYAGTCCRLGRGNIRQGQVNTSGFNHRHRCDDTHDNRGELAPQSRGELGHGQRCCCNRRNQPRPMVAMAVQQPDQSKWNRLDKSFGKDVDQRMIGNSDGCPSKRLCPVGSGMLFPIFPIATGIRVNPIISDRAYLR